MKTDETKRVIVTEPGETVAKPEGLPDELHGEPECRDWREKAFELARELEQVTQERDRWQRDTVNAAETTAMFARRLNEIESRFEVRFGEACRRLLAKLRELFRRLLEKLGK